MTGWRKLLTLASAAMVLALAALACGSSEPAGQSPAPAAPESAPSEAVAAAVDPTPAPKPPEATTAPAERPLAATSGRTEDDKAAPELTRITGWINSDPFTLEDQRGQVVLIDFWTYTCINCIRTFPYLRDWYAKYADRGLVIVGVHAYEFEFEKKRENIAEAARTQRLEYPIAIDNDRGTWDAYNNRFWPAKYLIDQDGYIRYTHFGEGDYVETEEKIRELLVEAGADVADIPLGEVVERQYDPEARSGDPANSVTRELYAGYVRNYNALRFGETPPYVAQEEFYRDVDAAVSYEDPVEHRNHFIYLHGMWTNGPESIAHARTTKFFDDYIAIKFFGTTVNVVLGGEDAAPYDVRVMIDGRALEPAEAGSDISFNQAGESYLMVDESRMYRVVSTPSFGGHELELSSNSVDFAVFAFTFGGFTPQPGS